MIVCVHGLDDDEGRLHEYVERFGSERFTAFGGTREQWFLDNASRWADALGEAGVDVVIDKRVGEHGGAFWYEEFPRMLTWVFERRLRGILSLVIDLGEGTPQSS